MPDRPTELLFDGINSSIGCGEQLSRGTGRRARLLLLPRVWSDSEAKLLREDVLRNVARVGSMSSSGRFAECTPQADSNADQLVRTRSSDSHRGSAASASAYSIHSRARPCIGADHMESLSDGARRVLWTRMLGEVQPRVARAWPQMPPLQPGGSQASTFQARVYYPTPAAPGQEDLYRLHRDHSFFTLICSLSDHRHFDGGGTFFASDAHFNLTGILLRPPAGSCICYDGALCMPSWDGLEHPGRAHLRPATHTLCVSAGASPLGASHH